MRKPSQVADLLYMDYGIAFFAWVDVESFQIDADESGRFLGALCEQQSQL
jgi:hypothetical protein